MLTSPGLVKAYLRQQNEYCSTIKSIAVDGITETAMLSGGTNGISIEQEIHNNCQGLESVEQTSQMNQRGRWFLIVNKEYEEQIRGYVLNTIIPKLESTGLPTLNGVPDGIAGSLIGSTTVGTYASVLQQRLTMKAADLSDDTLNHGTRYPKRRQVIPMFSAEPKPTLVPKAIHKSTSHANTVLVDQSSLGSSGVTQTTLSDRLAQWELKVENRLADHFREFETKQQTRLQELE